MPTIFNMTKDVAGYNGFGIVVSDDGYSGFLAQNVEDSVIVPSDYQKYIAIFSYTPGANVFVDMTRDATVPVGAIAADTSRLNPQARMVTKGTEISFITPDTPGAYVTIEFLAVQPYSTY